MKPEDIKKSTKEYAGGDPPFQKARGVVDSVDITQRTGQYAKPDDVNITLKLKELQVLATNTAYPYKVSSIDFKYTDAVNSKKGIFEQSIETILGETANPWLDIQGKTITVEREDNHLFFAKKDGTESRGTVWRVTDIAGASKVNPKDEAYILLDGKTKGDFVVAALTNGNISRNSELQSGVISGAFFNSPEVKEAFTVDEKGIYHRK